MDAGTTHRVGKLRVKANTGKDHAFSLGHCVFEVLMRHLSGYVQ